MLENAANPSKKLARPDRPSIQEIPIPAVQDGVFFTLPEALPRGRHKLPRDQIRTAQYERLLVAVTELLAAKDFRGFGAGDVAKRAGVSLAAFYDCFADKEACVFAGYDRFIEVLLDRMTSIESEGRTSAELVHTLLGAYLETLQSDQVVARAYQVEIDALGPAARERRRSSLELFAQFIRLRVAESMSDGQLPVELPQSAYIGVVYAARQLASDALDTPPTDLLALRDDLEGWVTDLFRDRRTQSR